MSTEMKLLLVDVETTGLDPQRHGLIQVAGLVVIDDKECGRFDFSVAPFPNDKIDDQALAVNGKTREAIAAYEEPGAVHRRLLGLLEQHVNKFSKTDKLHFVGYNALFDYQFLRSFWLKNGDKYFGSWFWTPAIDVMTVAGFLMGPERARLPDFKLATVARHFGLRAEGDAHDAAHDIELTWQLYKRLRGMCKVE